DHLDHICEEVSYLYSRLGNMKSSIVQTVFDEIKSSLPAMITNALKEQLPGILSATLKDCLPLIVNKSLQTHNLAISEQFAETQAQQNKKVVKQLNRQFNISHVQVVRLEGVREDLQSQTKHISKFSSSFQDIQTQLQDVKDLLELAGEHKTAKNITSPKPSPETQGEHAYKESTLLVSESKVNKESVMVLYNTEKDLIYLITTKQDSKDDDDLGKQPLSKRFKIMHPIPSKPQPSVQPFTDQLFGTTSLKLLPTPPREPTPPRDSSKAKRLGLPPPPELATLRLTSEEKKRKRIKFIKEMFVTKDVRVDGMNKNLIPPPGVVPIEGLVIKEPKDSKVMKGLFKCEASKSNVRRIQVKDIVKEVEDYLKTYSSAKIDISCNMDSSMGKMFLEKDVIEISSDQNEGSGEWDSPEYKDTAGNGEINLEKNDNLISNDYAVKLCLEYEVRKGKKLVKKELMVLLSVNFGEGTITIQPDFDPFLLSSDEEGNPNLDNLEELLNFDIDEVPQTETNLPTLTIFIHWNTLNLRGSGKEGTCPQYQYEAYKVKLDGKIKPEEERAMVKVKGQMLKEKKDLGAFLFPIRLEDRINENALTDIGSDTNTMPYRIYEQLGRDDIMKEERNITMINYTKAEVTGQLVNVLCQVGFTTLSANFLILEIPIDRDAPIVVGRRFLDTMRGNIDIPNMIFITFDRLTRQTFRAAKSEKIKIVESNSDDEEDYVIKRNEMGTPIHNSRPIGYKNSTNPAENMTLSTLESVINPFRKISMWKKVTSGAYDHEAGSSSVPNALEMLKPWKKHYF
ncbi:retrovirus-related pol polyprotein from transposon TNT 1-94, partial [Tanacetum coccineum]